MDGNTQQKRLVAEIPLAMHVELAILARVFNTTAKAIVVSAITKELERLRVEKELME
jgi:hypothetical protein